MTQLPRLIVLPFLYHALYPLGQHLVLCHPFHQSHPLRHHVHDPKTADFVVGP
jgi:hypothetical protein